jgi:hypothetical protein
MSSFKRNSLFFLILLMFVSPLSIEAKRSKRKKVKKVDKLEKGLKKVKAFTLDEKKLILKGGLKIVYKLRELELDAGDYLKAYHSTLSGVRLFKANKFGDAIYMFLKGFNYIQSPTIQFWMGRTYLAFGNLVKAKQSYDSFLNLAKSWKLTTIKKSYIISALKEITELKKKLVALNLICNVDGAEIAVNGEILRVQGKTVKTPYLSSIWLKPGYNYLVITKMGFVNKELNIKKGVAGKNIRKKIQLLTPGELIKRSSVFKASQKAKKEQERKRSLLWDKYVKQREKAEIQAALKKRSLRLFGYTTIGGGTLLVLIGGLYAVLAQQSSDYMEEQAKSGVKWSSLQDDYDKYKRMKSISGFISGIGATIIVGGVLITYFGYRDPIINVKNPLDFFVGSSTSGNTSISPIISPNQLGLSLKINF